MLLGCGLVFWGGGGQGECALTYCSHVCLSIFGVFLFLFCWLVLAYMPVFYCALRIWYFQRGARAKLKFPHILAGFLSQALHIRNPFVAS